jgi:peptidoglycan hydrolase CwlO-like protein
VKDNAEIRRLKRELEEHQKQYDAEIDELVNELNSVREEQKSNKASITNLNTLLQKEEDTILKKQREMNVHENTLQQLKMT